MFSSVRDNHSHCICSSVSNKLHIQACRLNVLLNSFPQLALVQGCGLRFHFLPETKEITIQEIYKKRIFLKGKH